MNNLMSFWLAPVTALFQPAVYRDAAKASGGRGVLYTLYISALAAVAVMIAFFVILMPKIDQTVALGERDMPVMIWTPEGLSFESGQATHTLKLPDYGPIVFFDMNKTNVTEQDMGKAFAFVTRTKVFLKRGPGQIDVRDITKAGIQTKQQLPSKVRITKEILDKFYQNVKNATVLVVPFVILIMVFIFNMGSNLFYSVAGLLFNLMRTHRLGYGAVFNLTCFARTAPWILGGLNFLPLFRSILGAWWIGMLVSVLYLFFAFKVTDQAPEEITPPAA